MFTLETRREVKSTCVTLLFLGSLQGRRRSAIGQFPPSPSNSPRSLCESKLGPVSVSFLKLQMGHFESAWETGPVLCQIALWECLGVAFLLANTKLRGKVSQSSSPKTVPLCFSTQNKLTLARDLKLPIPCGKGRGKFGGLART